MSNPEAEPSNSPESTYLMVSNPQRRVLSRKLFFLSVGTAAAPVFVAAGIILQAQHAALRHSTSAMTARRTNAPAITPAVEARPGAGQMDDTSTKTTTSGGEFAAAARVPKPGPLSVASLNYEITHFQSTPPENNILEHETLVSLTPAWVPQSLASQTSTPLVIDDSRTDSHTGTTPANRGKRMRAEIKTHTIAHHRRRPQKPGPTELFAKVGRSVKKALIHAVTFARE